MNAELLKSAIATIFKRKGKRYVTEDEFLFAASMELRWFTPNEAKAFLRNARRYGLVRPTPEGLSPTFNLEGDDLKQLIKAPEGLTSGPENPVSEMVEVISASTRTSRSDIMSRINRLKREMNIETQAAAALVAAQLGVNVAVLAQDALDELIASYSG